MTNLFDNARSEVFLAQISDTGVPGGTLSLVMHRNHLFLEFKSPHAMFSMLNNSLADLKTLRKAFKKAIKLHEEYLKKGKEEVALTRTQTDIRVAENKKSKTSDGRRDKASKNPKREKTKTGKSKAKKD